MFWKKSSVREGTWECWGTVNVGLQNGVCTTVLTILRRLGDGVSHAEIWGDSLRTVETSVAGVVCMGERGIGADEVCVERRGGGPGWAL